ncbi:reverse transcriptase domain-containing protein [Tanacetum coccineum]
MSPSQDSRDYVSHATSSPDTQARVAFIALLQTYYFTPSRLSPILTLTPELCLGITLGARLMCLSFLFTDTQGTLIKDWDLAHPIRNKADPVHLDFELEDTEVHDQHIMKGKEVMDEDLRIPFKEARRTPLTHRIIEFAGPEYKMPTNIKLYDGTTDPEDHLSRSIGAANSGEWPMLVWCRMFQQTLDGSARGWFERLPPNSINEWADLREAFAARYSVRRACFKEPHEITKIVRKANESLTTFKERWTVETDKVPVTVNEMMERLDDFVRSEEAYASTKLPKGEVGDPHCKASVPFSRRDDRFHRNAHLGDARRADHQNSYRGRDAYLQNRGRDHRAPYPL